MEKVEDGISLGELFSIVWKKKISIMIITLVSSLLCLLVIMLFVNPVNTYYTTEIDFDFIGIEDKKLPSGETFDYRKIIEKDKVNKALDDSNKSTINVDEFLLDLSITDTSNKSNDYMTYSISVKSKYFKNSSEVNLFFDSIIESNYQEILNSIDMLDFTAYLANSSETKSYETQLGLFVYQEEYIIEQYDKYIELFGTANNNFLMVNKIMIESYFFDNSIDMLLSETNSNYYVKNETLDELIDKRNYLENKALNNQNKIDTYNNQIAILSSMGSGNILTIESYNAMIIELLQENFYLENQRELVTVAINDFSNQSNSAEIFKNKVNLIEEDLNVFTNLLTSDVKKLYIETTNIAFANQYIFEVGGNINIILGIMVSAIMSCGISCVIFISLYLFKNKKTI